MSLKPRDVKGALDAAGPIWQDGAFHQDAWTLLSPDTPVGDGPVLVPKARWLAQPDVLMNREAPVGLVIGPGERLDDIAADIGRFALIALKFPKYADGRAYSLARLLREKYGYRGELRAVGNVLNDQIPLMWRVGFDSLEVMHAPTRRALAANRLADVKLYYQPAAIAEALAGPRPWLRRA